MGINVLSAGLLSSSGQAPAAFTQEILGERIVICTAAGMLVLDKNGKPLEQNGDLSHTSFCVFCLPLLQGGIDGPAASQAVIDAPLPAGQTHFASDDSLLPVRAARLSGEPSPRAPPSV